MKKQLRYFFLFILLCLFLLPVSSKPFQDHSNAYDFAISETFLKFLNDGHTIQPILKIKLLDRTKKVHSISDDCEIHISGEPDMNLGDPTSIVVEPPNLCKISPAGQQYDEGDSTKEWLTVIDQFKDKVCDVKGFPRIFTEHAQTGEASTANPNHVFEIHPTLSIKSDNIEQSFSGYLKAFEKMRHITASTAASCIENRTLEVRYNKVEKQYEFRENGGRCGNFIIVEVGYIKKEWIRSTDGGHSVIARVSPDGKSRMTLKLYTLSESEADTWLQNIETKGKVPSDRKLILGLLTYDYFSIIRALEMPNGSWYQENKWKNVDWPLALVVFGETEEVPWDEN